MQIPAAVVPQQAPVAHAAAGQQQQQQPAPAQQQPQPPVATKEDIELIREMFPNVEEEAVKSILEANSGNKEAAINALLSMQ